MTEQKYDLDDMFAAALQLSERGLRTEARAVLDGRRALQELKPSVPTREQIAAEVKRVTHVWSGPSMDEFINDPPTRKQYAIADAVLSLLNGADRG